MQKGCLTSKVFMSGDLCCYGSDLCQEAFGRMLKSHPCPSNTPNTGTPPLALLQAEKIEKKTFELSHL